MTRLCTAELTPGAQLLEVADMGHDLPELLGPELLGPELLGPEPLLPVLS